ncbi:type II secretion system F family protein [Rhizohabitans arisaemae]|uniref:type II secretion system F family protein n=1 Tax=Rhizohabitans arisaemae TaxID=2720610 RepID=UPI0024B092B7|nr:type II secretion system F family protein [Rhizohabitans arisaemae]
MATVELFEGLAAELHAGRAPEDALVRAIKSLEPDCSRLFDSVVAVAGEGGDIPDALRAALPGLDGVRELAACWQVSIVAGGTLAPLVENVARTLRDSEAHRQQITAELAGARATARLLAILPIIGMSLGVAMGMEPFSYLFGTLPGLICLVIGIGLNLVGLAWVRRLVKAAVGP